MIARPARAAAGTTLVVATLVATVTGPPPARPAGAATAPVVSELPLPTPGAGPAIITRLGDDLWFTEAVGNRVGKLDPTGTITEFVVPTPRAYPYGITVGPDGNLWFTEQYANRIGVLRPDGAFVRELPIPTPDSSPYLITTGSDGNVWFAENAGNKIARVAPGPGTITEFPTPIPRSGPTQVIAGPDGNIWFSETVAGAIGRITPAGAITEFTLPDTQTGPIGPAGLTVGPDGNIWYAEVLTGQRVGRILVHAPNTITEFPLPHLPSGPAGLVVGPDGNIWFTELTGDRIGRVTPAGSFLELTVPTPGATPTSLALGPDGTIWFTEATGNRLGHVVVPAAARLVIEAGGGQVAPPHHRFATRLRVIARDARGAPAAGVLVEFHAPTSGASAAFTGGHATATSVTDTRGVATAPVLTANGSEGRYRVVARARSGDPVGFTLTNRARTLTSGRVLVVLLVIGAALIIGLGLRSRSRPAGD